MENYPETLKTVLDQFKNNAVSRSWPGVRSFKYNFKGNFADFKVRMAEYASTSNRVLQDNINKTYCLSPALPVQVVNNVFDPGILTAVQDYYRKNIEAGVWALGDSQSRRYKAHNEPMSRVLHYDLLPLIEKITNKKLRPTYSYLSAYTRGADLPPHTDRADCEYTVSLLIDKPKDSAWNVYIHKKKQPEKHKGRYNIDIPVGECEAVDCDAGGLMLFQGTDHIHFRKTLQHDYYTIVLLHYCTAQEVLPVPQSRVLSVYTNKNPAVFRAAQALAEKNPSLRGRHGVVYDDFNADPHIVSDYKNSSLDSLFVVAPRSKTVRMDDKIHFHNVMAKSKFTPESFLTREHATDRSGIYFVKKRSGSGSKSVTVHTYDSLQSADTTNCVIYADLPNPHLYKGRRYKIRQLALLHNKAMYQFEHSLFAANPALHNDRTKSLTDQTIITQTSQTIYELTTRLEDSPVILKNITLALQDYKKYYHQQISQITHTEFVILGFDLVVDTDLSVYIIESNHRPNCGGHPKHVNDVCNIGFMKAMMELLVLKTSDQLKEIR